MEAAQRVGTRQIKPRLRATLGDIDKVDMLGSDRTPVMPDLHPTKRAGAIVVNGESGLGHDANFGLEPGPWYVAEARSTFPIHRTAVAAPSMTAAISSSSDVSSPAMASIDAMRRVTAAAMPSSTVPSA